MRVLILSHFNIITGPIEFLRIPEISDFKDFKTIPKHLTFHEENFFMYDYEIFKTVNLKFTVPSTMKRTEYEDLMISVIIIDEEISPKIFQSILKKCKEEIKNIKNVSKGLYNSSDENTAEFLEIKKILLKYYQTINDIDGIQLNIDLNYKFPWGTHMCYFYQKKEDLMDILIPYIKMGLEENQMCVWVTSEDLKEKEAKEKLESEIKNFNKFLEKGQIEIFPYTEWYLKDGEFTLQRVLDAWVQKYNYAISQGFDGIRVTGNTAWIEKKDWKDFSDYEEEINNVVGNYR
ncbi:MAG: MEDS domain-containing protein, partial [Candidatus Lokiarchaeota archaeon]|nr:MEDS domain-containing protein [Candidatus Lokiarchaeota archaeon]